MPTLITEENMRQVLNLLYSTFLLTEWDAILALTDSNILTPVAADDTNESLYVDRNGNILVL